ASELVDLGHAVVRHADRARVPRRLRALHAVPRPGRPARRPVDDVEVDLVDAEALEAVLRLGLRVLAAGIELRRDEDVLARHAALAQGAPDARLVAVRLRRVDVAVAELKRPPHRARALRAVRDLPDSAPEQRDLVAVGEDAPAPVRR